MPRSPSTVDTSGKDSRSGELGLHPTIDNVLPFCFKKNQLGQRVCLVTLYNVDEVSPRPVGSQLAVSEDGESWGFITGGCAESAIVHEALMAIKEDQSRSVRIGSDSPWFDIKLPCGAGIDLHFSVADSSAVFAEACQKLNERNAVTLQIDITNDEIRIVDNDQSKRFFDRQFYYRKYLPARRLHIFGSGPYVKELEAFARQAEFQVACWSPDYDLLDGGPQQVGCGVSQPQYLGLTRRSEISLDRFDEWTAAVLLFHEHDWEFKLLSSILKTDCFFVGALGSRKTQSARIQQLRESGICEADLNRIQGPVGLPIGARTPSEIALSILAQVVECYRTEGDVSNKTSDSK